MFKFLKTKITGDARSKLIVRDLTHTWELVRGNTRRELRRTANIGLLCLQNVEC